MGMFDSFKVDRSDIGLFQPLDEYQSKDLDCKLVVYRIKADGLIVVENIPFEKEYKEYGGMPATIGLIRDGLFTSELNFYGERASDKKWINYTAVVIKSRIVKLSIYDEVIYDQNKKEQA